MTLKLSRKFYSAVWCAAGVLVMTVLAQSVHAKELLPVTKGTSQVIEHLNDQLQQALIQGNINSAMGHYAESAILMPEYQPSLNGASKIRGYFEVLSARRDIESLVYHSDELLNLGRYVLDIGRFESEIDWLADDNDSAQSYTGKYWRIWQVNQSSSPKVVGEAFGFFEHIANPQLWVTDMRTKQDLSPSGFKPTDASIELKAYHAIGQQGVQQKNGELRSQLYASDAVFFPFANTPKRGIEVLKPYLIEYSSHGARIESVQTHVHEVINLDGYILEFAKFAVAWTNDGLPGRADGKGIALRKRMENGELLYYRHISMHNFDE